MEVKMEIYWRSQEPYSTINHQTWKALPSWTDAMLFLQSTKKFISTRVNWLWVSIFVVASSQSEESVSKMTNTTITDFFTM